MPNFFINRPIFAWVIAIGVMLTGLLAVKSLPVSQYPPIAPPQIAIRAVYPGASAQTVQDTVTQVIEQKLNGIDNLIYMSSTSDSSGAVAITLTFKAGTDPNIAQVQTQNKLQLAVPLLPEIVQRQQQIAVALFARAALQSQSKHRLPLFVVTFVAAGILGFVHDLTKDDIALAKKKAQEEAIPMYLAEQNIFGYDHAEVGAELMRSWSFPEGHQIVARYHHQPELASAYRLEVAIVHVAETISCMAQYGEDDFDYITQVDRSIRRMVDLSTGDLEQLLVEAREQFIEVLTLFRPRSKGATHYAA